MFDLLLKFRVLIEPQTSLFQLVGLIFLVADAYGSVWLQHESFPLVPPATGAVIRTVDSLDATIVQPVAITSEAAKSTVVAGPNSGATIVQGSVAGPVTIKAGSSSLRTSGTGPLAGTRRGESLDSDNGCSTR